MADLTVIELGNVQDEAQAKRIVEKLEGKTYMNFIVQYGTYAGNYPVSVMTERADTTEDELKDMVMYALACEI